MWQIYHNSRCSKSRSALELLEKNGVAPEIINYLETPLTADLISELLVKLDKSIDEVIRRGEEVFLQVKENWEDYSDDEKIAYIIAHPILLERPIVVHNHNARIGRPTEAILELFEG